MDVKTVCLGILTFGEASGYDIKKRFENSFAHFFDAGYGSIYPALAYLAQTNLVTCREEPQEGKPDRKVYCITEQGRQRFLEALANPTPGHKVRSEFLAMAYFAHLMTPEQLAGVFAHRLDCAEQTIKWLEEMLADEGRDDPPGVRFVIGFGLAVTRAARDYLLAQRDVLIEPQQSPLPQAASK